jgi:hypothetical protein
MASVPKCDINEHLPHNGAITIFGPSECGKTYFIRSILQARKDEITNAFVVVGGESIKVYRKIFPGLCVIDNFDEITIKKLEATIIEHTKGLRTYETKTSRIRKVANRIFSDEKNKEKYVVSRAGKKPCLLVIFDDMMTHEIMTKQRSIVVDLVTKYRHQNVLTIITAQSVNASLSSKIIESAHASIGFSFGSPDSNKKLLNKMGTDFNISVAKFNELIDTDLQKYSPDPKTIKIPFIRTLYSHSIYDEEKKETISTRTFYGIAPEVRPKLKLLHPILHKLSKKHMDKDYIQKSCFASLDKTAHIDVKKLLKQKAEKDKRGEGDEIFYLDLSKKQQ